MPTSRGTHGYFSEELETKNSLRLTQHSTWRRKHYQYSIHPSSLIRNKFKSHLNKTSMGEGLNRVGQSSHYLYKFSIILLFQNLTNGGKRLISGLPCNPVFVCFQPAVSIKNDSSYSKAK